ncbi:unnamed protein product [Ceutorhynchus assimilis]|uniref:Ig-like domain-containing protein n=1 Tax=Ceutorhynchus assimilis TaxID=467358 RepID=A0A9N9MK48_9CUCU|nr:unnamed protein product [Ceutorhynchus assimilis]
MNKLFQLLLVLCLLQATGCGFFSSSINKLKQKAKQAYKKRFGKDSAINIWGQQKSEYPGANQQLRAENRQKWHEYYECLIAQSKNLNNQKTITPEAIIGFETASIAMECKICLNPLESELKSSVEWEWASPEEDIMSPIEFTEHILVSPEDRTLHIYNLKPENSGQYMCKLGQSIVAPYFLTVVNISEDTFNEVHSPAALNGPYSEKPQELKYSLVLDTEWGEWTPCSKCNEIGRKHKLGYCEVFSKEIVGVKENQTEDTSLDDVKELFNIFKYGIPCQSHILPNAIRQIPETKCPEGQVFEIRDKDGKVLERANNSDGIYSLTQKLPPLEPTVERQVQYGVKGKDIVLECPGNINSDVPQQWQIGEKNLIPETIAKQSNGRIFISITDRVHIKMAKISDSNIYR